MPIWKLKEVIGDVSRFREIVKVLFEEGFDFLVIKLKLKYFVPLSGRWRSFFIRRCGGWCRKVIKIKKLKKEKPLPARLRLVCEKLGPSFIKLGQLLSLRDDLLSVEYTEELKKLQSKVSTFSYGEAERIIEKELGKPLKKIFKSFNKKPLAAASLAQVHKATLKDGGKVAVKVQRPGVEELIKKDIHILFYLASLLEKYVPASRPYNPLKLVREFSVWTMRELDFRVEGGNVDHFKENFKNNSRVTAPRVYWDYTTRRVLTMELMSGMEIDDVAAIKKAGLDPQEVAKNYLEINLKEFFHDGFFHADPHPGNIFVLPDGRLCFHDFGIVSFINEDTRLRLISYFSSLMRKDIEGAIKDIMNLAEIGEAAEVESFRTRITDILNFWLYAPQKQSAATTFYRVISSAAKYGISFPANLVLLGKSLLGVEAIGYKLVPDFDINKGLKPYLRQVVIKELSPAKLARKAEVSLFEYLNFFKKLPEETLDLLKKIEQGEIGVKINTNELRDITRELDRQNDARILAIVITAMVIGSAASLRLEEQTILGFSLGKAGFLLAGFLLVWFLFLVRKKKN